MPELTEKELKVYLYGLYMCASPLSKDNTIEHIKDALSLDENELVDIFSSLEVMSFISTYNKRAVTRQPFLHTWDQVLSMR